MQLNKKSAVGLFVASLVSAHIGLSETFKSVDELKNKKIECGSSGFANAGTTKFTFDDGGDSYTIKIQAEDLSWDLRGLIGKIPEKKTNNPLDYEDIYTLETRVPKKSKTVATSCYFQEAIPVFRCNNVTAINPDEKITFIRKEEGEKLVTPFHEISVDLSRTTLNNSEGNGMSYDVKIRFYKWELVDGKNMLSWTDKTLKFGSGTNNDVNVSNTLCKFVDK